MNDSQFEIDQEVSHDPKESELFSAILRRIGGRGKWQWAIFFIASYSGTALALGNLSSAFIAGVPDHWCQLPDSDVDNVTTVNVTRPLPICEYYVINGTVTSDEPYINSFTINESTSIEKVQCSLWNYDDEVYESTIVTEWDLVCNERWKKSTAQAIFMLGVLLGGCFLSELSDIYGRRPTILISTVLSIASSLVVVLSRDYISFVLLRFISAIFVTGVFLPSFVLCMEIVDSKSRTFMGMFFQIPFSIGVLFLPGLAYFIKSWRYFQAAIALLTSILMLNFWLMPESPRWLLWRGRTEEALQILKKGAQINKNYKYDEAALERLVWKINPVQRVQQRRTLSDHFLDFFTNLFKLVKTPIIRRRVLITCYQYFVVATVYYGLTLASNSFQTSPHILLTIGGTGDIVGLALAVFILSKFGRRNTLAAAYLLCGAACVCIPFIPSEYRWIILSFGTFGKITNSVSFGVIFIYSAELIPTPIRNVALGMASLFARLGSAIVPYIVDILGELNPLVPPSLFGILSLTAGCLAFLLPESANKPLPDTIEEVEEMNK